MFTFDLRSEALKARLRERRAKMKETQGDSNTKTSRKTEVTLVIIFF